MYVCQHFYIVCPKTNCHTILTIWQLDIKKDKYTSKMWIKANTNRHVLQKQVCNFQKKVSKPILLQSICQKTHCRAARTISVTLAQWQSGKKGRNLHGCSRSLRRIFTWFYLLVYIIVIVSTLEVVSERMMHFITEIHCVQDHPFTIKFLKYIFAIQWHNDKFSMRSFT